MLSDKKHQMTNAGTSLCRNNAKEIERELFIIKNTDERSAWSQKE